MYCVILHHHPQNFPNIKFCPKIKIYKFGTKIAFIGCYVLEFQKTNVVFEIGTLEFFKLRNFMEKLKYLNLAQKKLYLSVLGLTFWKISTLEFVKLQNFVKKWQCLNLVPKMPYWGIFGLGFENNIFGLEFENNIVIFEISNLEFVYLQNFGKKWKCLSLGPNMPYLGIFSAGISNEYCHIWNQHPQICDKCVFNSCS